MNSAGAVRYSFNTVGSAMWITTLALVAGFIVLAFSGYRMNSDMGLMSAITISLALVLDFMFLPTLLMKVEEKKDAIFDQKADKTIFDWYDGVFVPVTVNGDSRNA